MGDDKQNGKQKAKQKNFIRDKAQDMTLEKWKASRSEVRVRIPGGELGSSQELWGRIISIGPYSIQLRKHEAKSAMRGLDEPEEDICIFKTAILAVFGPRMDVEQSKVSVHAVAEAIANGPAGDRAHLECTTEKCFAGGDCPVLSEPKTNLQRAKAFEAYLDSHWPEGVPRECVHLDGDIDCFDRSHFYGPNGNYITVRPTLAPEDMCASCKTEAKLTAEAEANGITV